MLPDKDGPQTLGVRHYDIDLNVKTLKTVEWEARLRIEPLITNLHALRFDLANNAHELSHWDDTNFYPIRVTSVTDPDGYRLDFESPTDVSEETVYSG